MKSLVVDIAGRLRPVQVQTASVNGVGGERQSGVKFGQLADVYPLIVAVESGCEF